MKKFIKIVLHKIGFISFLLVSPKILKRLTIRLNQIYTFWKVNEFNTNSLNIYIQYPLYSIGGRYIKIGENFNCGPRLRIEAYDKHLDHEYSPTIIIGDNVSINHDCHIGAINEVIIEDGVLIASKVFITDHYHGEITIDAIALPPSQRKLFSKGAVKIGKNVWIGEGVVILPNTTIGQNSIIGANTVISKNIPENSVVGGNPSKIIRTL